MWVAIENHRRWDGGFFLYSEITVYKNLLQLCFLLDLPQRHTHKLWSISLCRLGEHLRAISNIMPTTLLLTCAKKENKWMKQFSGQKPKSTENVWIVSSSCTIYWFNDYKLNHSKRAHFLHHTDDLGIGCRTNLTSWKFFPQSTQKLFAFLNVGRTWNNWKQFGTKWTGDMLNFSDVFNKLFCSLALFPTSLTNMYG